VDRCVDLSLHVLSVVFWAGRVPGSSRRAQCSRVGEFRLGHE
jgi:hypothetical protein